MICFLGDVHGHFEYILPTIGAVDEPKAVIFLGDQELQAPFEDCIRHLVDAGIELALFDRGFAALTVTTGVAGG